MNHKPRTRNLFIQKGEMEMKRRIYIFVLLVLLLAALPELALAAGPSPVASVACDYRSHVIAYPTANIDTGSADCLAGYAIPYPAADFEGDGITSFVRSATTNPSADLSEGYIGEWRGTIITARTEGQAAPEVEVNSVPSEGYIGEWRGTIITARTGANAAPEVTANPDQTALELELSGRFGRDRSYGTFVDAWTGQLDHEATASAD
jgi:hypothetical protein